MLVIAAALSLVFSTAAIAAVSLLQQRMGSMNKEKLEDYKGKGVAFFPKKSTFFLPDREMTDEELLQIIDFYVKRDYSLAQINTMIDSGEMEMPKAKKEVIVPTDNAVLSSESIYNPTQELIVPYTGNLEITEMQAGIKDIFLAGYGGIHKMQVGSGDSELFFNDFGGFDIKVDCMVQADDGTLYIGIRKYDSNYKLLSLEVWGIDTNGKVIAKLDVTEYIKATSTTDTDFSLNIIAKGQKSDFVLWSYEGIFTYNLGDKEATLVLPPYEAPCQCEGISAYTGIYNLLLYGYGKKINT